MFQILWLLARGWCLGAAGAIKDEVETGEEPSRIAGTVRVGSTF